MKKIADFDKIVIERTTVHTIFSKKNKVEPYAISKKVLFNLEIQAENALKVRISKSVKKSKRFFETSIENIGEGSFWDISKKFFNSTKDEFIAISKEVADLAASKHTKGYIPGGLLIIIECKIDGFYSILIIKAEFQEAFALKDNLVELITELFLSPAKELFKIGFLIRNGDKIGDKKSYISYVYDDHFSPKNDDLATYFYKDFLGFGTSDNDKIHTNNFFKDYELFIEKYISNFEDKRDLKINFKNDLKAQTKEIIDPSVYIDLFPEKLQPQYQAEILTKYDKSFSKDLSLVDNSLKNYIIEITSKIKLSAPPEDYERITVSDAESDNDKTNIKTKIDSGTVSKIIMINNRKL